MLNFELRAIYPITDKISGEIVGGDAESINEYPTKIKAFTAAKRESNNTKWHEVMIYQYNNNGDIINHWYFKNGKLTHTMF